MDVTKRDQSPTETPFEESVSVSDRTIHYPDRTIATMHTDSSLEDAGDSRGDETAELIGRAAESRPAPDATGTIPRPDDPAHSVERGWDALQADCSNGGGRP